MKTQIVVFDLDQTLASNAKRYSNTPVDKSKATQEEWDLLMEGCENDPPIPDMIGLCRIISRAYNIVIMTAREEKYRDATEKWLKKNVIFYSSLIMRPEGNKQTPWDYKSKELAKLQLNNDIIAIFDDEEKTCQAANDLGITALKVNV